MILQARKVFVASFMSEYRYFDDSHYTVGQAGNRNLADMWCAYNEIAT